MLDANATSVGIEQVTSAGHLSPGSSLFFAVSGLLAFAALVARARAVASHHRRLAAIAAAWFQPDAPYGPGNIVLHGRVATAEGSARAVRVEVEQQGSESESSGVWSYTWTEISREVLVAPFYIVDAAGRRTRVEPPDDVQLVDALEGKALVTSTRRIRSAELTPGEEVWATGELVSAPNPEGATEGYRGRAGLVLRAPAGQFMILSSEPLTARFEAKARLHRQWSHRFLFLAVMAHGLCFGPYLLRVIDGETRSAKITRLNHHTSTRDNDSTADHYNVSVTIPGEVVSLDDEVSAAAFARLQEGQLIPIRRVRSIPQLSSLGPDATVGSTPLLVAFFGAWGVAGLLYRREIQRSLRWYETKVIDAGKGKLADSR